ncbi:MAG: c-type cytochrome [Silvibacterium sp.]|nr:c-type cytochrome [Silvibacterium sp.]
MMKKFLVAVLFVTAGFIASQYRPTPAHAASAVSGVEAYANHCAICHGDNREGILPAFPPLQGITRQMTDQQITEIIHSGRGRMPGFPKLGQDELTALLQYLSTDDQPSAEAAKGSSSLATAGGLLFQQNCAFCHGRDAEGGESGPDLTQSRLVRRDRGGDRISEVIRNGRPEKKMPAFHFSEQEMHSLVAFIHEAEAKAVSKPGGRRGVEVADLQTGNVSAGRDYFNGEGRCSSCHSPSGDLAGIASRYEGLQLEEQMLYPREAKNHATVTLPSGEKVTGTVAYLDEFTIALRDSAGQYRSWSVNKVKYKLEARVNAHAELLGQYSDDDIHNLMAYLQTLR